MNQPSLFIATMTNDSFGNTDPSRVNDNKDDAVTKDVPTFMEQVENLHVV